METISSARELITIEEFLTLSAKINYQLSARSLKAPVLLSLLLGPATVDPVEQDVLLEACATIRAGYDQDRRRLGTPGILHPLRAAALLARTSDRPSLLGLLAALFHDKDEDLTEKDLGADRFVRMEGHYKATLEKLPIPERGRVEDAIRCLTNHCGSYSEYVGQVTDHGRRIPELLHVKLADRIDNTFDVHLQHPGVSNYNFYRAVFDILFLPTFRGVSMGSFHFMPDTAEGVMLLSQLFKDTILLAMLRNQGLDRQDETTRRLFVGLAVAGIREAQWLALEMFNTVYTDVKRQRDLLLSVMDYCATGGIDAVRAEGAAGELDGVFVAFTSAEKPQQKQMLTALFEDRERLAQMSLAFIVVFAAFINDPTYTL
ncbi:MAG: HD domain-containing protein, partial [Deltaproteobacteria bacterium]|nr:HD domain-containing protein [Deltaproteobacteria bacterium]